MPEISRFFGVVIKMYYREHNPPHFHAEYGSEAALIEINPIRLYAGALPRRALSMVFEWAALHQQELANNWDVMRAEMPPAPIAPLE